MSYFTVCDLIIIIPMALAGALFFGSLPCNSALKCNSLKILGAVLGVGFTVVLVQCLPAVM